MPEKSKQKRGISRKVILIICVSSLTVMLIGMVAWYFFDYAFLRDTMGDVHRKMSQLLAGQITKMLDDEISQITSYADNSTWGDLILKSNLKYSPPDPSAPAAGALAPIEHPDIDAAARLKALAKNGTAILRLSVLGRDGSLIAASEKRENLLAPDDKLRRRVFSDRRGRVFVGDIYFDEITRAWAIPVAVPIRDQNQDAIGILRADISSERFFSLLRDFRVDRTGYAFMIDEKGNIIFHPGNTRINVKFCSDKDYKKLLTSRGKYATIYEPAIHQKQMFMAFSEIAPPLLLENHVVWRVLIAQESGEVFAPLGRMFSWTVILVIFLIIITVLVGFFFSRFIVRPIHKLHEAAVQIMWGNWDYPIDIKTGDEVEQFADTFKDMVATIKDGQEKLISAKKALEELSKTLEKKVEERTEECVLAKDEINNYAKELERALLIKSDFISVASHELRTPLAAIKEGVMLVLEQRAGTINNEQREFLDMARRNVDRLGRIINNILDIQKIEHGKLSLKKEENDINEVVREIEKTMGVVAAGKGLDFMIVPDETIPKIKFDKDKITQVLTNLVNNAIKFTKAGSVKIVAARDGDFVKVSVIDTGIGIKVEDMGKLFNKFTQLQTGMERKPGGTGLGLAISRDIIQMHNGKIWADSRYGRGSSFYFTLPVT